MLMLPDSVPALKMHLQAIGTLFQSYGPEALCSEIPRKLFLGFRPYIVDYFTNIRTYQAQSNILLRSAKQCAIAGRHS